MVSSIFLVWAAITSCTDAPSFNCRYAKTASERLVCSTPALAALDRELADIFNDTVHQGGINGRRLQQEEQAWIADVRDLCTNATCVAAAYEQRLETLRDQSLRAASPEAYAETRPFSVAAASAREARALVGHPCSYNGDVAGFKAIRGFMPITFNGYSARAGVMGNDRFAFLLKLDSPSTCSVSDAVALPPATVANAFLSCGGTDVPSPGVGLRLAGNPALVAYWFVDITSGKFHRQPAWRVSCRGFGSLPGTRKRRISLRRFANLFFVAVPPVI